MIIMIKMMVVMMMRTVVVTMMMMMMMTALAAGMQQRWSLQQLAEEQHMPTSPADTLIIANDGDDGDDIYIMMKCLSVCLSVTKNDHFLLGVSCNHLNPP